MTDQTAPKHDPQAEFVARRDAIGERLHPSGPRQLDVVQSAMALAYVGDLDQTRAALEQLPPHRLHQVATAAEALGAVAAEIAASR